MREGRASGATGRTRCGAGTPRAQIRRARARAPPATSKRCPVRWRRRSGRRPQPGETMSTAATARVQRALHPALAPASPSSRRNGARRPGGSMPVNLLHQRQRPRAAASTAGAGKPGPTGWRQVCARYVTSNWNDFHHRTSARHTDGELDRVHAGIARLRRPGAFLPWCTGQRL